MNFFIHYELPKLKEKLLLKLAWMLPKGLVYWCAIRVMAHATTGKYTGTVVPTLTGMDALKRWETFLHEE